LDLSSAGGSRHVVKPEFHGWSIRGHSTFNTMIDAAEYEFIRQLVYDRSRINLGPDKVELVCSRLRKRARTLRLEGLQEYIDLLRSPAGAEEVTGLMDVISTNVTDFFREPDHFDFLRDTVLPEWRAAKDRRPGDVFQTWSAACSSGEEPYTLAIVLSQFFRTAPRATGASRHRTSARRFWAARRRLSIGRADQAA